MLNIFTTTAPEAANTNATPAQLAAFAALSEVILTANAAGQERRWPTATGKLEEAMVMAGELGLFDLLKGLNEAHAAAKAAWEEAAAAKEATEAAAKAEAAATPATFNAGETYSCRSICNYETIYEWTVTRRTAASIWIEDKHGRGIERRKIQRDSDGNEYCYPDGRYSMCPIIRA
jgi:hypothetical protein